MPYADRDLWVSLVYYDREPTRSAQAVCPETGFVTTPSLATLVETFLQPSLLGYAAAAPCAVVATDPVSADILRGWLINPSTSGRLSSGTPGAE